MVSALITVAVIAWLSQLALGGWQIRQFNRAFDRSASKDALASGAPADVSNRALSLRLPSINRTASPIPADARTHRFRQTRENRRLNRHET
jgi:hypothetical protein